MTKFVKHFSHLTVSEQAPHPEAVYQFSLHMQKSFHDQILTQETRNVQDVWGLGGGCQQ